MRSFYNEDCELFHALTLEQYLFLIDYWKTNQMDGKWCFEIWSTQDDDPKSWAKLSDLPYRLNPESIDGAHFGGMGHGTRDWKVSTRRTGNWFGSSTHTVCRRQPRRFRIYSLVRRTLEHTQVDFECSELKSFNSERSELKQISWLCKGLIQSRDGISLNT
jgi:hypothetical protein